MQGIDNSAKNIRSIGSVEKYDLYYKIVCIGNYYEKMTSSGVRLSIVLNDNFLYDAFPFKPLSILQKNGVIDDDGVRFWMDCRAVPKTQDGIDELLERLGMSEYSILDLMHMTNAVNTKDHLWINFNRGEFENFTYETMHPGRFYLNEPDKVLTRLGVC